ncbi:MAG: phosphotransferase [Deltaproteobacteria bacterium]|nr:phosphotransferase [Deltaproteobacteria bacterium]
MWFIEERLKLSLMPRTEEKYRRWRARLLNSGVFRAGSNLVFKRVHVSRESLGRVLLRLERIRTYPPARIARLHSYRWLGDFIELRMEEIHGHTLREFTRANAIAALRGQIGETLSKWLAQGFIHGDLSPTNILVAAEMKPEVRFVDWVSDLESFEGTPRYASPETFAGRRSHDSDVYAASKIFKDYDRGFRSRNPLVLLRNAGTYGKHFRRGFTLGRGAPHKEKTRGTLCSLGPAHPRCAPFLF